MARVAEQAERFDDMVDFLRPLLKEKGGDFSVEERNLLSVGFKNLIGGKRTAIRTISAIEQNPKYQKFGGALGNYKKKIEGELQKNCQDIIDMIKQDGMKTSDAFNIFLAQVELRKDMPFSITSKPEPLLTTAQQGKAWEEALGEY